MIIYCITNNLNGKQYVGQTTRSIHIRFKEHSYTSDNCKIIDSSIRKYGIENFSIKQIDIASSLDELDEKEIYWIKELKTLVPTGYNICIGGNKPPNRKGIPFTAEHRRHLSENNGMRREEHRLKVSRSKLGIKRSEFSKEWINNLSKSQKGHKRCTEKMRQNASSRMILNNPMKNKDVAQKVSKALMGKPAWNKGKAMSNEQKLKISNTLLSKRCLKESTND